jgi:hypothetical protein
MTAYHFARSLLPSRVVSICSAGSFLALDDGLLGCIRRQGQLLKQHCSSSDPSLTQAAAILARADAGDYYPMAAELDVTGWVRPAGYILLVCKVSQTI